VEISHRNSFHSGNVSIQFVQSYNTSLELQEVRRSYETLLQFPQASITVQSNAHRSWGTEIQQVQIPFIRFIHESLNRRQKGQSHLFKRQSSNHYRILLAVIVPYRYTYYMVYHIIVIQFDDRWLGIPPIAVEHPRGSFCVGALERAPSSSIIWPIMKWTTNYWNYVGVCFCVAHSSLFHLYN